MAQPSRDGGLWTAGNANRNFHQVLGKTRILFRIAAAALGNPDGAVRDVIFPVAVETVCRFSSGERHDMLVVYIRSTAR